MNLENVNICEKFRYTTLIFLLATMISAGNDVALVEGLYNDGLWQPCRIEARRGLLREPDCHAMQLLLARAEIELDMDARPLLRQIRLDRRTPPAIRWPARYEEALLLWKNDERPAAAEALREVFLNTADYKLFLLAGCTLALALREQPMPWEGALGVGPQLRTAAPQWNPELIKTARLNLKTPKPGGFAPGQAFIKFYRSQIRPAIGDRCILTPSCSEYSLQAFNTHGLLGIPMTTDRFIREPSVVSEARYPVSSGSHITFADPLADHNWWFYNPKKEPSP